MDETKARNSRTRRKKHVTDDHLHLHGKPHIQLHFAASKIISRAKKGDETGQVVFGSCDFPHRSRDSLSKKLPLLTLRLELTLAWPAAGEPGRDVDNPSDMSGVVGSLMENSFGGMTGEPSSIMDSFSYASIRIGGARAPPILACPELKVGFP